MPTSLILLQIIRVKDYKISLAPWRVLGIEDYKTSLAPWRELGIDKCGFYALWCGCRHTTNLRASRSGAAAKHTPRKGMTGKPNRKARRSGAVPAEPLRRRLPLFPPRTAFFHYTS